MPNYYIVRIPANSTIGLGQDTAPFSGQRFGAIWINGDSGPHEEEFARWLGLRSGGALIPWTADNVLQLSVGRGLTFQNLTPSFVPPLPTLTAQDGVAYASSVKAIDPVDNTDLTLTIDSQTGSWVGITDGGDGTATLQGTPGVGDVGAYNLVLKAANSGGEAALLSVTITVAAA